MSVPVGRPGKTSWGGCQVDPEGRCGFPRLLESLPGGEALIPFPDPLTTASPLAAVPGWWLALSQHLFEDWGAAMGAELRGPTEPGYGEPGTVS